jgi:hypothetical protein
MPSDMRESQGDEYYYQGGSEFENSSKQQQQQKAVGNYKVIQPLGIRAGIRKSDFDISLDENSQQWFERIFQYWKQCKLLSFIRGDEIIS